MLHVAWKAGIAGSSTSMMRPCSVSVSWLVHFFCLLVGWSCSFLLPRNSHHVEEKESTSNINSVVTTSKATGSMCLWLKWSTLRLVLGFQWLYVLSVLGQHNLTDWLLLSCTRPPPRSVPVNVSEWAELHEGDTGQVWFLVGMYGSATGWIHCTNSSSQNGGNSGLWQAVKSISSLAFA